MEESPVLLTAQHRRLRHIKGIIARNLVSPEHLSLVSSYYMLYIGQREEAEQEYEGTLVYTSEVVKETMNPTWRHLDSATLPRHLQSSITCKIQVWTAHPEKALLFEHVIDMRTLEYIGTELKHTGSFGPNSLILELLDGFYTLSPANVPSVQYDSAKAPNTHRPMGMSCNRQSLLLMLTYHKQLEYTAQQTEEYINEIHEKLLYNKQYSQKLQRRDMARLRVSRLKEQYEKQLKAWQEDKARAQTKRKELLPRIRTISKAEISLLASKKILVEDKQKLENTELTCEKISQGIASKKWELISQLRLIFPINSSPDQKCLLISGFRLPNSDFNGCDEEQIATALGFVCHVLFMVSKYLEVPLRYNMIPMCSRSVIRDDISQQISPKFPLYSRGVDRTRFEYAVFLLNKNVEQLLNSLGMDCLTLRQTLPNLQALLEGPKATLSSAQQISQ